MKIGMVAWSFYPRVGGSAISTFQLVEALQRKDIKVEIIAPLLKKDENKASSLNSNFKIHWIQSPLAKDYTSYFSRFAFFIAMKRKIRQLSSIIDIFHVQDFNIGTLSAIYGTNKPIISVFGADPIFEIINFKRKKPIDYKRVLKMNSPYVKLLHRLISFYANKLTIVVSVNPKINDLIKRYTMSQIIDIPCGIDIGRFQRNPKPKNLFEKKNPIILTVCRYICWKNIDYAVEIFKEVQKEIKDARMVVIGKGPLYKYYRKLYGKLRGVAVLTDISYEGIANYYHQASIFLYPSQYETFGIVLLEAMASKTPIVASNLDVFSSLIKNGETGYLVNLNDKKVFSRKIVSLLKHPEESEKIAQNAFECVKRYDINKIANEYICLYEQLLKIKNEKRSKHMPTF